MSLATHSELITDVQLSQYARLIYDRTGIRISPQKKNLLSNRLRRRLRATGITSYARYFSKLQELRPNDPEWDAFLQEITTHETYLFRDMGQWDWFRETFIPEIQAAAEEGVRSKSLRIWSAACSTGDEAYTIACCVADKLRDHSAWNVEIVGTDIGVGALEQARHPEFQKRAMHRVPQSYERRFFTKVSDGIWTPRPELTAWMSFSQHNLMKQLSGKPFDLVILKNVLIYFDGASKNTVFQNVDRSIRSGGLLMIGPAEAASGVVNDYEKLRTWLYRKSGKTVRR